MKLGKGSLAVLLWLSISSQAKISGIKVLSSTFDAETRTTKLTFVNTSKHDITAYGWSIAEDYNTVAGVAHSYERSRTDFLRPWIQNQLDRARRPWLPKDAGWGHPIHPGENTDLTYTIQKTDLLKAVMTIGFVVYSDGSAEFENQEEKESLTQVVAWRKEELKAFQLALRIAEELRTSRAPRQLLIEQLEREAKALPEPLTAEETDRRFAFQTGLRAIVLDLSNPSIPDDDHFIEVFIGDQKQAIALLQRGIPNVL